MSSRSFALLHCSPLLAVVGALIAACGVQASVHTVPTSLNAGDQYRLIFVTGSTRTPTTEAIDIYDDFVTAAADAVPELLALATDWKVVGSTRFVNARVHTGTDPTPAGPTGVPIFLLNDTQLATDYDDLWDGSLARDLNIDENGNEHNSRVWTGSFESGVGFPGRELGAANFQVFGNSTPTNGSTTPGGANGWMYDELAHASNSYSFYAISDILTVPGTSGVVPEPGSFLVWGALALTCIGVTASHRRRNG
jgi:hypothetical protein